MRADWRDRAACKGMADPSFAVDDPFFPEPKRVKGAGRGTRTAVDHRSGVAVCRVCPVRDECFEDEGVLGSPVGAVFGVRAGMTAEQREAVRRSARRAAVRSDAS